jgi:N-acetylglucosamine-6-sulfatase
MAMRRTVLLLASMALAVMPASGVVLGSASGGAQEPPSKPNIVFIYADDMRHDELAKIESLANFADQGTEFSSAYVTNSVCCPSRTTALTGQYSHTHGVLSNVKSGSIPGGYPAYRARGIGSHNLGVYLKREGYATSLYGKFLNHYGSHKPPNGFDRYYPTSSPEQDPKIGDMAAEFVRHNRARPMFLALWVKAPHEPLEYPDRYKWAHRNTPVDPGPAYDEADKSDKSPWVRKQEAPGRRAITTMGRKRLRMLEGAADAVERVRAAMARYGEAKNTFYVFASDNGYLFGEHGLTSKMLPYEESVRIPMFWVGPDVRSGAVRDELVTNNDIAPTILELTGARASRPVDGRSLLPLLKGEEPDTWRTAILSESPGSGLRPAHRLVRTVDRAFIEWEGGFRELYDMAQDPHQLDNLLAPDRPSEDGSVRSLEARLTALRSCEANTCVEAENGISP